MLRNYNVNFFPQKKTISLSCTWISNYDIIYNSLQVTTNNFVQENRFVNPPDSS